MSRSMVSGNIGSRRQDYRVHVSIMLNRLLTKEDMRIVDRLRKDGKTFIECAEAVAADRGEKVHTYPILAGLSHRRRD